MQEISGTIVIERTGLASLLLVLLADRTLVVLRMTANNRLIEDSIFHLSGDSPDDFKPQQLGVYFPMSFDSVSNLLMVPATERTLWIYRLTNLSTEFSITADQATNNHCLLDTGKHVSGSVAIQLVGKYV